MTGRIGTAICVSLALATAIHLDWHAARPTEHHLSLGLFWHWLMAVPVFGLVAWYVARAWPSHVRRASLWIVGAAVVAAGLLEPAWEYFFEDATFEWAFGQTRTVALAAFVATGVVAYIAVMSLARRQLSGQDTLR
jgi:hypothetical protein